MKTHYDVAVMHDYFVDRLVHVGSVQRFAKVVAGKARVGGGGLHGVPQEQIRGGNAVNLASALARLGAKVLLLTHSDESNKALLLRAFDGLTAEVRVKPIRAGLTVAFEGRVNVMIGDGGGAADFGPEALEEEDWSALGRAKVVCSVNWAANARGTQLLRTIRNKLGPGKTVFMDPADFRDRAGEFGELVRLIAEEHLADWVSMNELEAKAACEAIGLVSRGLPQTCLILAKELGVSFDLHASRYSYRSDGRTVVEAPVRQAKAKRLTGAGDVWDSGSIYGRLRGWDDRTTLGFANSAARLYLESPEAMPPTLDQVMEEIG